MTPTRSRARACTLAAAAALLATGCGPSEAQIKVCNDAKATSVKEWSTFVDAVKKASQLTAVEQMKKVEHDAVIDNFDAKDSDKAKLAAEVKAAEKSAAETLDAAVKAAESLNGAEAQESAALVKLSATAMKAVEKARTESDRAHNARSALADALIGKPGASDNPRLKELEEKRAAIGAELARGVSYENLRLAAVFPLADKAKATTEQAPAACEAVEKKK